MSNHITSPAECLISDTTEVVAQKGYVSARFLMPMELFEYHSITFRMNGKAYVQGASGYIVVPCVDTDTGVQHYRRMHGTILLPIFEELTHQEATELGVI